MEFDEVDPLALEEEIVEVEDENRMIEIKSEIIEDTKQNDRIDVIKTENDEVPKYRIDKNVIVYTTRLDNMCIFQQNLHDLTKKDLIDYITCESKPKLRKLTCKPPEPNQLELFNNMLSKLEDFNIKNITYENKRKLTTAAEIKKEPETLSERATELLKICKPAKIVLSDFRKSVLPFFEKDPLLSSSIALPKTDCMYTTKNMYFSDIKKLDKHSASERNKYFLFRNLSFNDIDIYYIDGNGNATDYYLLNSMEDNKMLASFPFLNSHTIVINCCCWYQREDKIKSMWPQLLHSETSKFMRRPHKCSPDNCNCCCRNKKSEELANARKTKQPVSSDSIEVIDSDDDVIQDLEKEISNAIIGMENKFVDYTIPEDNSGWLQDMLKNHPEPNTLIDKASRYSLNVPKEAQRTLNRVVYRCTPQVLQIKDLQSKVMECYEIGTEGDLVSFANVRRPENKTNYINAYAKSLSTFVGVANMESVCCWFKREKIIAKYAKNLSKVVKFIRRTHKCPFGDCNCCCRLKIEKENVKSTAPLLNIDLPQREKHKNNLKKTRRPNQSLKNYHKQPDTTINNTSCIEIEIDSDIIYIKDEPNEIASTSTVNTNNNSITSSAISQTNNPPLITVPPLRKILPKPVNAPVQTPELEVDSLISTILDRFQDVRLTINEDGKVAAALNTPVNNLSTAELKVLANILSHAQEQVKALGLGPGTYTNNQIGLNNSNTSTNAPLKTVQGIDNVIAPENINTKSKNDFNTQENVSKTSNKPYLCQVPPILFNCLVNNPENRTPKVPPKSINQLNHETTKLNKSSPLAPDKPEHPYKAFSRLISQKNKFYDNSFQSLTNVSKKNVHSEHTQTFTPIIESVFSLNDVENASFCNIDKRDINKTADTFNPENVTLTNEDTQSFFLNTAVARVKRKLDTKQASIPTKIRVVSPSKLSLTSRGSKMQRQINKPVQSQPKVQTQTTELISEAEIPQFKILKPLPTEPESAKPSAGMITVNCGSIQLSPYLTQVGSGNLLLQGNKSLFNLPQVIPKGTNNVHFIPIVTQTQSQPQNFINTGLVQLLPQNNQVSASNLQLPQTTPVSNQAAFPDINQNPLTLNNKGNVIMPAQNQQKNTDSIFRSSDPDVKKLQPVKLTQTPSQIYNALSEMAGTSGTIPAISTQNITNEVTDDENENASTETLKAEDIDIVYNDVGEGEEEDVDNECILGV